MRNVKLIERIGIDRTTIDGFEIIEFDEKKFIEYCEINEYSYEVKHCNESLLSFNEQCYEQISIAHDSFIGGGFSVKTGTQKDTDGVTKEVVVSSMDVMINASTNNLQNLTAKEYQDRTYDIFEYMRDVMGITCEFCDVMFKKIEINATFKLKDDYNLYAECLRMINRNLPKAYQDKNGNLKYGSWQCVNMDLQKEYLETVLAKNDTRELKIYNKISHLKAKGYIYDAEDIMRIEYKITRRRDIIRLFSAKKPEEITSIFDITDDDLYRIFMKLFRNDIVKPYELWTAENHDELLHTVQQYQSKYSRWTMPFLRHCSYIRNINQVPLLFDITDMREIIKEIEPNKKNVSLKYKRVYDKATELSGNREHMNEIIDKVLGIEKAYDLCKTKSA